jgi:hypothetical protein
MKSSIYYGYQICTKNYQRRDRRKNFLKKFMRPNITVSTQKWWCRTYNWQSIRWSNEKLYPQNPSINRGHWKSVEDKIVKWLRSGKYSDANIEYQARLVYENDKAMRPEGMHFLVKFKVGNRIATFDELNKVNASI